MPPTAFDPSVKAKSLPPRTHTPAVEPSNRVLIQLQTLWLYSSTGQAARQPLRYDVTIDSSRQE